MWRRLFAWALSVLLGISVPGLPPQPTQPMAVPTDCPAGYRAVAAWDMDFLAVGTGGRVALLTPEGGEQRIPSPTAAHLHDVLTENGTAWIVGDAGTVLHYDGTRFASLSAASGANLYTVVKFGDRLYLGGSGGRLYVGSGNGLWKRVSVRLRGDITGLAATDKRLVGVTSRGETFTTADGDTYTVVSCSPTAAEAVSFSALGVGDHMFYASGTRADGTPVVMTTIYGGVWSERPLDYIDGAGYDPRGLTVRGMAWDGGQMMLACNDGQVLMLPDCTKCNHLETVATAALTDTSYNGGKLAAVGESWDFSVVDTDAVRQYAILPSSALAAQQEGALIIDVRDAADYAVRHIAGSLSIPLSELAEMLPTAAPDKTTQLIFYCTKGVRSQKAIEIAMSMEYYHVYSLGAMDDWPYDFA